MRNADAIRIDCRYSYRVDTCIDSDNYVWTLLCDGQDLADGYESTAEEAKQKAKQAYREHMAYVNDEEN